MNASPLKNKGVSQALIIVALIIALAAIVGLIIFFWQRGNAPQTALAQVLGARSYHTSAELIFNQPLIVQGRERPFPNIRAVVEGDVLRNQFGTPELTGGLYVEAKGRGEEFRAEGDLKILNDAVAFRLDSLPVLLNPTGSLIKRWTYVPSALLQTHNTVAIQPIVQDIFSSLNYQEKVEFNGQSVRRFTGSVTPEQEEQLTAVFDYAASHNHALNVLARLLRTTDVKSVTVDVTKDDELAQILIVFIKKLPDGREVDRAGVRVSFTELNKDVVIEAPVKQATVRPEIFGKLFGSGTVTPQN